MFNPRERSQAIAIFAIIFVACLLLGGTASAAPSIILSKKSGPPTSKIVVSGRGFEPNVGATRLSARCRSAVFGGNPFAA